MKHIDFNCTDSGNAERFAKEYADTMRWCEVWDRWVVFNGRCWERDETRDYSRRAKAVVRNMYREAERIADDAVRKQLASHALKSESSHARRAMVDLARGELPATVEQFNQHVHLLNCRNGTLDLRDGTLRKHNPADMLTRCIDIDYKPDSACPQWEEFLLKIMSDNQETVAFLQTALGMSLSGDTREQCFFICHGLGSNGKSTLLECVRNILGPYGHVANIETFQAKPDGAILHDRAALYGKRFVTTSENKIDSRLNEAFVKEVTGERKLRAGFKYENEFEFQPELTVWIAVNHLPVIKDTTHGMWRRIHKVNFSYAFKDTEIDLRFGDKLQAEYEGILAWLVQGCVTWYRQGGLIVPQSVKDATQEYKSETDTLESFFQDECVIGDVNRYKAFTKDLQGRYKWWCEEKGIDHDARNLIRGLHDRDLKSKRSTGGRQAYAGIAIRTNQSDLVTTSDQKSGKSYMRENIKNFPDFTSLGVTKSLSYDDPSFQEAAEMLNGNGHKSQPKEKTKEELESEAEIRRMLEGDE